MADKHPCTMCIKSFLYISQIAKHLLPHSGEKLHKCDQCDKSFGQAGDLKKHMIFHAKEKLQTCIRYGKSFSQGAVLKKHLLTHNGEKLFKCAQCNTSICEYGKLRKHPFNSHRREVVTMQQIILKAAHLHNNPPILSLNFENEETNSILANDINTTFCESCPSEKIGIQDNAQLVKRINGFEKYKKCAKLDPCFSSNKPPKQEILHFFVWSRPKFRTKLFSPYFWKESFAKIMVNLNI